MSTVQKIAMGIVGIGLATALLLPGRNTVGVIGAIQKLFQGSLGTAIQG
ncbi:MAG TPA: hypothetical protein VNV62_18645 [Trebonia sp.]|nr:hypothetical protein [Trebonia sp.]